MELSFAANTDVGRERDHNEDNFLIDKNLQLFIVADGMGGHAAGEIASSMTVHQIRETLTASVATLNNYANGDPTVEPNDILQILEHAIQDACTAVFERAQDESEKRGMGTTASVLLILGGNNNMRGFIGHVGDSRIYLARKKVSHQLTEDHSLQNELIRRGKIKEGEFETSAYAKYKNAVTRAVGVYESVEVDTFDFDILPGDQFMLCSDGMYAYLEEEELPAILSKGEPNDASQILIDMANAGGGHDNITTLVVRIGDAPASEDSVRAEELALKIEVLQSLQLFRYLSYKELVSVMNITETIAFNDRDAIITEGDKGDSMFVVLSGKVILHKGDLEVAVLGSGHHFGEMALVDRTERSLSASASGKCRLITIKRKEFYAVIKNEHELSVKLLWSFVQVMADRLRKTTAELSDALGHDEDSNVFDSSLFKSRPKS